MGNWIVAALAACALVAPARAQQAVEEVPIQTVDEAIDRLPPIGKEGTYDATRRVWNFEPAVAWLQGHIERGGTLSDEQWRRALLRSGAIRFRERWPVDLPFAISLEIPAWLPSTEIRVHPDEHAGPTARAGNTGPVICGNCRDAARRRWRYQELESLPLGPQVVTLHVVVEQGWEPTRAVQPRSSPKVLWKSTLDLPVSVVATLAEVLLGAHGPDLDPVVKRAVRASLVNEKNLWVCAEVDRFPELATTALALEVELWEGTTVRETEALVVLDRAGLDSQSVGWTIDAFEDPSKLSICVRGSSGDALRVWNAERYWDGEFVIPLAEVERH